MLALLLAKLLMQGADSSQSSSGSQSSGEILFFEFSTINLFHVNLENLKYTYILWIGDNVDHKYKIELKSHEGIFFIDAMDQAAAKNPVFAYEYQQYSWGKFITKIAGVSNDIAKFIFL